MYNYLNKPRVRDGKFSEVLPLTPRNAAEAVTFPISTQGEVGKLLEINYTGFMPDNQQELFYPRFADNAAQGFTERPPKIYAVDNSQRLLVATDGYVLRKVRTYNSETDADNLFWKSGLARIYPSGKLDDSFALSGLTVVTLLQVEVLADGNILLLGTFTINGATIIGVVRITSYGSLDKSFNYVLPFTVTSVNQLVVQKSGLIVLAGNFTQSGSNRRIIRLNSDGTVKNSPFVVIDSNAVFGKILQHDDHLIFVSSSGLFNGESSTYVAITNTEGVLDRDVRQPEIVGFSGADFPIVCLGKDGNLVIAGRIGTINGVDMPFIEGGEEISISYTSVIVEVVRNGNVKLLYNVTDAAHSIAKVQRIGEGLFISAELAVPTSIFLDGDRISKSFGDITGWTQTSYDITVTKEYIYGCSGTRIFKFDLAGKLLTSDKLSAIPDLVVHLYDGNSIEVPLTARPVAFGVYDANSTTSDIVISAGQTLKLLLLDRNSVTSGDVNTEIMDGKIAATKCPVGTFIRLALLTPPSEGFSSVIGVGERNL